jgi:hypothetical protein
MRPRTDLPFRSVKGLQISWALRQRKFDAHRVQSPLDRQLDCIAGLVLEQRTDHRLPLADPLQVDSGDDVADLETRRV